MKLTRRTVAAAGALAPLAFSNVAFAADYFSEDAVKAHFFPQATRFDDATLTLTKDQRKAISKQSGVRVRGEALRRYRAMNGEEALGFVVIDEVLGKHEFITYAIALTPDRAVSGVEVMRYLETYGDEVRNPAWRAQFDGKRAGDVLKVTKDIANISGATLSCVHLTEGVRRVLATLDIADAG